jgi:hypothetical protein
MKIKANPKNKTLFQKSVDLLSETRKWIVLALLILVLFFGYSYFASSNSTSSLESDTNLIQMQLKNVSKLVVTEGHFAEVLNYKDNKKYFGNLVSFEKKALVVVNADVTVSFDLSKIEYDVNQETKTVTITNLPKEEIKISPDYKYFDTKSSNFNEFNGEDYNKINKIARANLKKKIDQSTLKTNAQNRLLTELSRILITTNSMGWKLEYNGNRIENELDFNLKN